MKHAQALLVRGWVLNNSIEMAVLTLGLDATDQSGSKAIQQSPNYAISPKHCRELAAQLLQVADRIEGGAGTA